MRDKGTCDYRLIERRSFKYYHWQLVGCWQSSWQKLWHDAGAASPSAAAGQCPFHGLLKRKRSPAKRERQLPFTLPACNACMLAGDVLHVATYLHNCLHVECLLLISQLCLSRCTLSTCKSGPDRNRLFALSYSFTDTHECD